MIPVIVLDTTPLGLISQKPRQNSEADACHLWMRQMTLSGYRLCVPEIADYEVRRELIRARKTAGLARLDAALALMDYLPITTQAMRLAADLWGKARNSGWGTADPKSLDGDVILAAQALTIVPAPASLIVATVNVAHLSRYLPAAEWRNITP